jgi:hypothetical protein
MRYARGLNIRHLPKSRQSTLTVTEEHGYEMYVILKYICNNYSETSEMTGMDGNYPT